MKPEIQDTQDFTNLNQPYSHEQKNGRPCFGRFTEWRQRLQEELEVASLGFQIERDAVQAMFEQGRISWKTAKEMRDNLSLLELQIS